MACEDASCSHFAREHSPIDQPVDLTAMVTGVYLCPRVRRLCVESMNGDDVDVGVYIVLIRIKLMEADALCRIRSGRADQETKDSCPSGQRGALAKFDGRGRQRSLYGQDPTPRMLYLQ